MDIVTRTEWGARAPTRRSFIDTPTPRLWLHHSAGALDAGGNGVWWDDVRGIQDFHMRPASRGGRGWTDVAYSFLIGGGRVFEGRGVGIAGGHTAGENTESHGICLIGNYEIMEPTPEDLRAIADLVRHGRESGWWEGTITGPHAAAPGASTACCGRNLIAKIPDLRRMAAAPAAPDKEEDDMPPPLIVKKAAHDSWWIQDGVSCRWIRSIDEGRMEAFLGNARLDHSVGRPGERKDAWGKYPGVAFTVPAEFLDAKVANHKAMGGVVPGDWFAGEVRRK